MILNPDGIPYSSRVPGASLVPAARQDAAIASGGMTRYDSLYSLYNAMLENRNVGALKVGPLLDMASLDILYQDNDYATILVDKMPDECTRKGWTVAVSKTGNRQKSAPFDDAMKEIGLREAINRADKLARKDGGGAVYMVLDDNAQDDQPVNPAALRKGILHCHVIERWMLTPDKWCTDLRNPNYGKPETYTFNDTVPGSTSGQQRIHESRLLIFSGKWISRRLQAMNGYWPLSVLQNCHNKVVGLQEVEDALRNLIKDFSISVLKVTGLTKLMSGGNTQLVRDRLSLMNEARSISRMMLLDDSEEHAYQQRTIAGLSDLYDRLVQSVAAAGNMPVTMFAGQAPSGLSTDDKSGGRNWNNAVADRQTNTLQSHIEKVVRYLGAAKDGPVKGVMPDNWLIKFHPIDAPTESEKAETRLKNAQADQLYINWNVLQEKEVRESRFGGVEYGSDITLIEEFDSLYDQPANSGRQLGDMGEQEGSETSTETAGVS